ncbi:hypothetical protein [Paraglaciecola sp. MB-3u-78]|uniref:hypothetical protein n=1 Tax=Paraglaciecola sp. MB-3u-78 TaxID=2058332 RepID=UPI000C34FA43|nr:hypothetical protein [Paraglaciecola sp. MB-3u-78]PKG98713.1 hypothetical protein CXF95_12675 [Paraglaciecola sp. MB-3u-78]
MKNVIFNSKVLKACALAGGLLMSTFSAQADLVLSFGESDVEVGLNDTFTLELFVETEAPVDSIISWGLDLDFDNGILALNSFTLGSDFFAGFTLDGDMIGGVGNGAGAGPFGSIFGSNILLGTFEFTAVGYGLTSANTSSTFGDIFEGFTGLNPFVSSAFNSASANISVVSAPATVGLFAVTVLGLAGFRRKA